MFHYSPEDLSALCALALDAASRGGADAAEAEVGESGALTVQVRHGDIEQIEHHEDKSFDVTVFVDNACGRAGTADFSPEAVERTVRAALDIASFTAQDDCAGLADKSLMALEIGDTGAFFPEKMSPERAVEISCRSERAALEADKRITNSEGAGLQNEFYQFVYGNSHGFSAHKRGTRHSISCSVVAEDGNGMQRDYWYDLARDFSDLDAPELVGTEAARRALSRLSPRSVPTGSYPVVFDAGVSGSLIGHLVGALSGGALYRKTSFLGACIGKRITAPWVRLEERPHVYKALGSTYFDNEGVATRDRTVIADGMAEGYFLSSYSARKLGLQTTGNAGGAHNLYLNHTHPDQVSLLKEMGTGLLVTELMGQGVNAVTGDYSRGAAGFWVENGVIAYPVDEITIASRLQDMLTGMLGAADDALKRSTHKIGSVWIDSMTVAGQ